MPIFYVFGEISLYKDLRRLGPPEKILKFIILFQKKFFFFTSLRDFPPLMEDAGTRVPSHKNAPARNVKIRKTIGELKRKFYQRK